MIPSICLLIMLLAVNVRMIMTEWKAMPTLTEEAPRNLAIRAWTAFILTVVLIAVAVVSVQNLLLMGDQTIDSLKPAADGIGRLGIFFAFAGMGLWFILCVLLLAVLLFMGVIILNVINLYYCQKRLALNARIGLPNIIFQVVCCVAYLIAIVNNIAELFRV